MDKLATLAEMEPIGEEELRDLGWQLGQVKHSPEKAVGILSSLSKKHITASLLKSTLIGKSLTSVSTDPEHYAAN